MNYSAATLAGVPELNFQQPNPLRSLCVLCASAVRASFISPFDARWPVVRCQL